MHPSTVASRRPEKRPSLTALDFATFHEGREMESMRSDEPAKSLIKVGPHRPLHPECSPVPEMDALDQAVELALHYRDHHAGRRRGEPRVRVCRCPRFDPAGEPFMRRLHAEIYSKLRKGRLHELLFALETASGRPGLYPKKEKSTSAVA